METEVCSLYIFDPQKKRLTLWATMGLDPESVGKVTMGTGEGLTGLVIEKMKPVAVIDALKHPRSNFPETHEEHFHSFLGVPLFEQKKKPNRGPDRATSRGATSRNRDPSADDDFLRRCRVLLSRRGLRGFAKDQRAGAQGIPETHGRRRAQAAFL